MEITWDSLSARVRGWIETVLEEKPAHLDVDLSLITAWYLSPEGSRKPEPQRINLEIGTRVDTSGIFLQAYCLPNGSLAQHIEPTRSFCKASLGLDITSIPKSILMLKGRDYEGEERTFEITLSEMMNNSDPSEIERIIDTFALPIFYMLLWLSHQDAWKKEAEELANILTGAAKKAGSQNTTRVKYQ